MPTFHNCEYVFFMKLDQRGLKWMLNESVSDKSGRYMQSHLKTWLGKTCLLENFLFTGTHENAQNTSRNNLYAPFGQRRLKPLPSVRFPEIHVRIFPQIQQMH